MKKQYIKPQTIVCHVGTAAILAVSGEGVETMVDSRPSSDVAGTSATSADNQFTKQYNYNLWEDE